LYFYLVVEQGISFLKQGRDLVWGPNGEIIAAKAEALFTQIMEDRMMPPGDRARRARRDIEQEGFDMVDIGPSADGSEWLSTSDERAHAWRAW